MLLYTVEPLVSEGGGCIVNNVFTEVSILIDLLVSESWYTHFVAMTLAHACLYISLSLMVGALMQQTHYVHYQSALLVYNQ